MFNGKLKAVTFSYDDGVEQDGKLIEIFDKYGLKGTFNLNSGKFGVDCPYHYKDRIVERKLFNRELIKDLYASHEVAVHTVTHTNLTTLDDDGVLAEVLNDKRELSKIVGYDVCGMAYPCGGVNNDDRVADLVKTTGIKYARTVSSTHDFSLQSNLLRFNPSVYHLEWEKAFELAEKFVNATPDKPQIFYIWGHSYELDCEAHYWNDIEKLCKLLANRNDIFYGTNKQVLLSGK